MVKTLKSILDKVPPATVDNPVFRTDLIDGKPLTSPLIDIDERNGACRIVAEVPRSVKTQMRERLYKNPEETERTILLKGLRAIGFIIGDEYLIDQRKSKR